MKKVFIIGNWKSYKTSLETTMWFQEISNLLAGRQVSNFENKEVVLCVPFTLLSLAKSLIEQYTLPITLGVQDISPFGEGKYTGEINGKQIAEFAKYVIIGHSERRKYFDENEEIINQKIEQAVANKLTPIVCISELAQVDTLRVMSPSAPGNDGIIIAYEPLFAIGSGTPDTPENADSVASDIAKKIENTPVIYGGSVTSQNAHSFTNMPSISGILPGGASLDAQEFAAIVTNA